MIIEQSQSIDKKDLAKQETSLNRCDNAEI